MNPSVVSLLRCGSLAVLFTHGTSLAGPTIQWDANASGNYTMGNMSGPANDPADQAARAGQIGGSVSVSAGYLMFDFTSLSDLVLDCALQLDIWSVALEDEPSMPLRLFDVTTPISDLISPHAGFGEEPGTPAGDIMTDLESGTVYGTAQITPADAGSHLSVLFNQAGIDSINAAAGGYWAIGLSVDYMSVPDNFVAFSSGLGTQSGDNYLNMQIVPEPSTIALFAIGGITAALAARRRTCRADLARQSPHDSQPHEHQIH